MALCGRHARRGGPASTVVKRRRGEPRRRAGGRAFAPSRGRWHACGGRVASRAGRAGIPA